MKKQTDKNQPNHKPSRSQRKRNTPEKPDNFHDPLPQDPIGQHFVHYFPYGWLFIERVTTENQTTQWITEKEYPLDNRERWAVYRNSDRIIGVRFGNLTNYFLFDIDSRNNPLHPVFGQEVLYNQIKASLKTIGIHGTIETQSSDSQGIHLYGTLPKMVNTFKLACALEMAVTKAGFKLKPGSLEIFPNIKPLRPARKFY